MRPFDFLLDKIHEGKNCYSGFPVSDWQGTWYNDPGAQRGIFSKSIQVTSPTIIIEVGSFVGESAIHMAKLLKKQNRECAILCIDTWYAGFDHWKGARDKIRYHFGRPDFYYKFISNVIANGCQDIIVPMASDSINAARILDWLDIHPQLIYVDGSHEEGDVYRDYEHYWKLLAKGGGMLVDDLTNWFPGVLSDWHRFCGTYALKAVWTEGEKALLIKT